MTPWLPVASAAVAAAAALFAANTLPAVTAGRQPVPALQPLAAPPAPQAGDSLDGTWELVAVIDNGKLVPMDVVKHTMIQDGRVVIKGQVIGLVHPDGKARTLAFVTDPKASPKTIDLAGVTRTGGKGIYMRDGDTLVMCVSGSDADARPAQLASLPGSDTFLMTFRRVSAPPAADLPQPPPPPPARPVEDATRRMLVGTWGHQNDEKVVKMTFNADGTFAVLDTYKRGLKKVFDREDRTSGTWRLKDGEVILTMTASTIKDRVGQVQSYRITSISESEVLYVDNMTGQRRIEWKLR